MKIEMGESLLYSWLRHVKECQIVQTNWKASPQWELRHSQRLQEIMAAAESYFKSKYGFPVFKDLALEQTLKQAEVDVLGVSFRSGVPAVYAIDVAFHEAGLNYGTKAETVHRVAKKYLRTALCLYGYLDITEGEIIFASPKINNAELQALNPVTDELDRFLQEFGLDFHTRLIANDEFESVILNPILLASEGIADTSELFLRSYQMYKMFSKSKHALIESSQSTTRQYSAPIEKADDDPYSELKIGKIVRTVMRQIIESGILPETVLEDMQSLEYSKKTFDLQFPALISSDSEFDKVRYYAEPLKINGREYYLCSQWYEVSANNDRPYLLNWLKQWGDNLKSQ